MFGLTCLPAEAAAEAVAQHQRRWGGDVRLRLPLRRHSTHFLHHLRRDRRRQLPQGVQTPLQPPADQLLFVESVHYQPSLHVPLGQHHMKLRRRWDFRSGALPRRVEPALQPSASQLLRL